MKILKEKWSRLDFDHKTLIVLSLVGIFCVVLSLVIAYLLGDWRAAADYAVIAWELGGKFFCIGVGALVLVLVLLVFSLTLSHLDFQAGLHSIHRLGLAVSAYMREKNAKVFAYRLQYFLYGVLRRNNEFLHLPLGQDFSCLAPRELSYSHRENCVFYHFTLITPEQTEMDMNTLSKIIQGYIEGELYNYGITGLGSCFTSRQAGHRYWSVYLDRVTYDEMRHWLTFDLLYICTEKAAEYVAKAIQRDTASINIVREIIDDELQ